MPQQPGEVDGGLGLLVAVRRYWWLVALTVISGVLLGLGLSSLQPSRYTTAAQVLLTDVRAPTVFGSPIGGDAERRLLTEARRMESKPVLARAAGLLDGPMPPAEIGQHVDVQASTTIDLLRIEAVGDSGEAAAALANAVAEAYRQVAGEGQRAGAQQGAAQIEEYRAQLQSRVDQLDARLGEIRAGTEAAAVAEIPPESVTPQVRLDATQRMLAIDRVYQDLSAERNSAFQQLLTISNRAGEVGVQAAATGAGISSIEPASAPAVPSSPQPRRDAALGGGLGVLVGCMLAWWRADRGQSPVGMQAANLLDVPRLGVVPFSAELAGRAPRQVVRDRAAAEAFRLAAASLSLAMARRRPGSVVITGARAGAGTTTAALNIARAAARGGRSVILVDGDTRTQGLTSAVGLAASPGVRLVPARESPGDRTAFAAALRRIERECELAIVDAPPLPSTPETLEMAAHTGGVVLVITRMTTADELEDVLERLRFTNTPLLGFLLNDVRRLRWWKRSRRREPAVAIDLDPQDTDTGVVAVP